METHLLAFKDPFKYHIKKTKKKVNQVNESSHKERQQTINRKSKRSGLWVGKKMLPVFVDKMLGPDSGCLVKANVAPWKQCLRFTADSKWTHFQHTVGQSFRTEDGVRNITLSRKPRPLLNLRALRGYKSTHCGGELGTAHWKVLLCKCVLSQAAMHSHILSLTRDMHSM